MGDDAVLDQLVVHDLGVRTDEGANDLPQGRPDGVVECILG
jgi:hypothetical protein